MAGRTDSVYEQGGAGEIPLIRILLISLLTLPTVAFGAGKTIEGTVTKVYDGDTIVMQNDERVRVRWINTPEKRPIQAYADEAQNGL